MIMMTRYHFISITVIISKHQNVYFQINTQKKVSFSKENFFDQSKIIENKKIKVFLEKTTNSKTILKKSINFNEKLIERSKRLIER